MILHVQSPSREEEEEVDADGANYQLEMMRCLREINVDNNTVGWYVFVCKPHTLKHVMASLSFIMCKVESVQARPPCCQTSVPLSCQKRTLLGIC